MIRKRLIVIAVVLLLGCAAFVYGLRWVESAMTFRPSRMAASQPTPADAENVWFNSADGTRLNGWFFPAHTKPELATGSTSLPLAPLRRESRSRGRPGLRDSR